MSGFGHLEMAGFAFPEPRFLTHDGITCGQGAKITNRRGSVTVSMNELKRVKIIEAIVERRLSPSRPRSVAARAPDQRLLRRHECSRQVGLVSANRGRVGNRQLPIDIRVRAIALVRERYADFGPTLACEKLCERHGFTLVKETVRRWMRDAGILCAGAPRRDRLTPF